MKRLFKLLIIAVTLLATVLTFTACAFGDGDYKAAYKKTEINKENVDVIISNVNSKISESSYLKYEATYKSDYSNPSYGYNTKYDALMKVNGNAGVNEVFAYIELKSYYAQDDGLHSRDLLIKYCIVRTSNGTNYSDYKVYMQLGEETFSATYDEMIDEIDKADVYLCGITEDMPMSSFFDYENNQGAYFETLYGYAMTVVMDDVVSTLDNPLIFCLHELNKGSFISSLSDVYNTNLGTKGLKLYSAGEKAYKLVRKYDDKKFLESYDNVSYIKLNDDGTYAYKYVGTYETKNPARAHVSKTEQELKPLTSNIEIPSWVK